MSSEAPLLEPMPFSPAKQEAVLGHLLTNNTWFYQAGPLIKPEWFTEPLCARIFKIKMEHFRKHGLPPTYQEMMSNDDILSEETQSKTKLLGLMERCVYSATQGHFPLSTLSTEMTDWMQANLFKHRINQSIAIFNNKQMFSAYSLVGEMMLELKTKTFNGDVVASFEDLGGDLERDELDYSNAITTGLKLFDKLLTPKAKNGGLLKGDSSVVLAPSNVGKTSSMITIACANIKQMKDVLLITHEGSESSIKEKIRCCMLGFTPQELFAAYQKSKKDESVRKWFLEKMNSTNELLKNHLLYIPMNRAGLTVEEVASTCRRRQDEWASTHSGKGFDLLVNDYPAKLISSTVANAYTQKRNMDDYVYQFFVNLALEMKWHSLVAIQTNREGSKNNKWYADRLLTIEDVSESFGPMQSATNVWSINRDPIAASVGRLTYYIDKSRSSETGIAVVCKTDYAKSTTHSNKLGAVWYKSTDSYTGMIDSLLTSVELPMDGDGEFSSEEIAKRNITPGLYGLKKDSEKM